MRKMLHLVQMPQHTDIQILHHPTLAVQSASYDLSQDCNTAGQCCNHVTLTKDVG